MPVRLLDSTRAAPSPAQELDIEQDEEGESRLLDASLAPTDSKPPTDEPPTNVTAQSDSRTPLDGTTHKAAGGQLQHQLKCHQRRSESC